METVRLCKECGAPLAADSPEGLCPKCLIQRGLTDDAMSTLAVSSGKTVIVTEEAIVSPPIGTKIRYFGDYELLDEIAHGGMGIVYKARQVSLNRIAAVKMILTGQFASEAGGARFHIEGEAAPTCSTRTFVAIHEVGEHEGAPYFSMDYVEGGIWQTGSARIPVSRRNGPPPTSKPWLKQSITRINTALFIAT
jgi:serine/threonine protein kinase